MQRTRKGNQLIHAAEWSRHARWIVTMTVDHRTNVTGVHACCYYGPVDGGLAGHAHQLLGPFDDLNDVIQACMVDAASNCGEQLTLWPDRSA